MDPSILKNIEILRTKGELAIDFGPKHPTTPNTTLTTALDKLLKTCPFLKQDKFYVSFLEYFGGLSYSQKKYLLFMDLFGISEETSTHLLFGPGDLVTPDGFLTFCSIAFCENPDRPDVVKGIGFGFDATGSRKWGIYRTINSEPFIHHSENFMDWFELFVSKDGLLID